VASYSKQRTHHATLVGTTVDTVTLSPGSGEYFANFEVLNRDAADVLWVTYSEGTPADPAASADGAYVIPPNTAFSATIEGIASSITIKVLGDGGAYSVQLRA
jgi:hypothetical protein